MGAGSNKPLRAQYLVFHMDDRTYGIRTASVEEIVPVAELSAVPGAPAFLAGLLDVGGRLVAVISLRRLMGMRDREPQLYTPLVIFRASPRLSPQRVAIAIQIDSVSRIVEIGDEDLIPISAGCSLNDCAIAVARVDDRPVVVLSPERLLLHEEQRRVADLAELARQRLADVDMVSA